MYSNNHPDEIYENLKPLYENVDVLRQTMKDVESTYINSSSSSDCSIEEEHIYDIPDDGERNISYEEKLLIFEKMVIDVKEEIKNEFLKDFNIEKMNIKDVFSEESEKIVFYYYWSYMAKKYRKEDCNLKYMLVKERYKKLKEEIRKLRQQEKLRENN